MTTSLPPTLRFGIYDFDPSTRELRREGAVVRLQAQPAQVLAMLLAQPGEVVPREALRQAVWGADTFVDFDRGLNFCIAQIRAALRDSADSPLFVRTLPKRGYQFIAPVTVAGGEAPTPPRRPGKTRPLAAGIAALAVAFGILLWLHPWSAAAPTLNVAVTRFDNQTGSVDFDRFSDGLADSVVAELTAAGAARYGVIGNAAILRKPRNQRDLIAIGSSLHAEYVILGQVQRSGAKIILLAHLIRLPQQTHVKVTRIEAPEEEIRGKESELAKRIVADLSPRITSSHPPIPN
jgi:DNA-binding winged helix-turn-helix (wHTH) protein/TolB-like protein